MCNTESTYLAEQRHRPRVVRAIQVTPEQKRRLAAICFLLVPIWRVTGFEDAHIPIK